MPEQELDLNSLGLGASTPPPEEPTTDQPAAEQPSGDDPFIPGGKKSKAAEEWDDRVKEALRKNVTNHELACLMVDIVSPGTAVERLGGAALTNMSPMQHLLVATAAVGGVVLISNPDLLRKLKGSIAAGKARMSLPEQRGVAEARKTQDAPIPEAPMTRPSDPDDPLTALGVRSLSEPDGGELL